MPVEQGVYVTVKMQQCPTCGAAVDLVRGPGQGVSQGYMTDSGAIVYRFSQRPFWACTACEWCEEANGTMTGGHRL
jgi:hypothetical protein